MPAYPDLGPRGRFRHPWFCTPQAHEPCLAPSVQPPVPLSLCKALPVTVAEVTPGLVLPRPTLTTQACSDSTTISCRAEATLSSSLIALGPARHSVWQKGDNWDIAANPVQPASPDTSCYRSKYGANRCQQTLAAEHGGTGRCPQRRSGRCHPSPRALTGTAARGGVVLAAVSGPLAVRVAVAASPAGAGGPARVVPAGAAAVPAAARGSQQAAGGQQPARPEQRAPHGTGSLRAPRHDGSAPLQRTLHEERGCAGGSSALPHRPRAGRGDKARSLLLHRPSAPWQGKDFIQLTRVINKAP